MRVASVSKAFSAAVALALVNRGQLSLRRPIRRVLPWLPKRWGRVTLGQALQHTSGLPDFSETEGFLNALVKHPHARPSPRFLLSLVSGEKLHFRPGSRYRYSNTDNIVVALMAEARTRMTYNQLLSRYVYRPALLLRTSLPAGWSLASPYLHGYQVAPGKPPEDVSGAISAAYTWASGGVLSTPRDLNRFVRAYTGAVLFSRSTQAAQFKFVSGRSDPTGPGVNSAGLGIFRYRTRCGAVYGHTGNLPGYTQFAAATRDGSRSVTMSVSAQITQRSKGKLLTAFKRLRAIEVDLVCAAMS
jgi:D-alanyl-D-alanine carboxypeptidase